VPCGAPDAHPAYFKGTTITIKEAFMLTINTWRDPYETGSYLTRPKQVTFQPGITILVGCNGAGKSTLLMNIEEETKKEKIPFHLYNNLQDGGSNSIGNAAFSQDWGMVNDLWSSSEGEAIKRNFGNIAQKIHPFLKTGFMDVTRNCLARIFQDEEEKKGQDTNVRVLLFDAIDSGLSVDSVMEISEVFDLIMEDSERLGVETYIIASANEYELARNRACFDVNKGAYVDIPDYEAYRTFILNSRKTKEKRLDRQELWQAKQNRKKLAGLEKDKAAKEQELGKMKAFLAKKDEEPAHTGPRIVHGYYVSKWDADNTEREIKRIEEQVEHLRARIAQDILSKNNKEDDVSREDDYVRDDCR
jgi:uncharacterized protein YeeX (DUF496 family)